jgi:hypothetical protein
LFFPFSPPIKRVSRAVCPEPHDALSSTCMHWARSGGCGHGVAPRGFGTEEDLNRGSLKLRGLLNFRHRSTVTGAAARVFG